MSKQRIYVSPSRWRTRQRCRRQELLAYGWEGTGLRRAGHGALYFDIGHAVHEAARSLWVGASFDEVLTGIPKHFPDVKDMAPTPHAELYLQEAKDLAVALAYVWYKFRYSTLTAQYEVLMTETPVEFCIYEDADIEIFIFAITDGLLRNRFDGSISPWEMKTIKTASNKWILSWQNSSQVVLEQLAAEELARASGLDGNIAGVEIEALLKGSQRTYADGIARHSNSLVWPYYNPVVSGNRATPSFSFTYKPKWTRVLASQTYPGGLMAWLERQNEEQLLEYSRTVPAVNPSRRLKEAVIRQVVRGMLDNRERLDQFTQPVGTDEWWVEADDLGFEMNTDNCDWPSTCGFADMCHGSVHTRRDPIGSGFYEKRVTIEERLAQGEDDD